MADPPAQHPAAPPATVADVMQPPVTAVEQNDHAAAAAYLMKRAGATALIVTKMPTGQPIGIITEADISRAVADGKNPNDVRIYELMTTNPTVVSTTASIRDAAALIKLPAEEQTAFTKLWDDAAEVLKKAENPSPKAPGAETPPAKKEKDR